jgi:hypothetical protein
MTTREKEVTLETWMHALDAFKVRLRKCLRIVLSSGIPLSVVRQAVIDILDETERTDR